MPRNERSSRLGAVPVRQLRACLVLIYHHHQRGADELPHRGLKEFGSEQLPFQRFAANQAYYYLMVVSFFLFESFKEDNLQDILPLSSYATTLRRKLDSAVQMVTSLASRVLAEPSACLPARSATSWARIGTPVPSIPRYMVGATSPIFSTCWCSSTAISAPSASAARSTCLALTFTPPTSCSSPR